MSHSPLCDFELVYNMFSLEGFQCVDVEGLRFVEGFNFVEGLRFIDRLRFLLLNYL